MTCLAENNISNTGEAAVFIILSLSHSVPIRDHQNLMLGCRYALFKVYEIGASELVVHPNSAAAQLGLTSAEIAPIQRELIGDELGQPPNAHNHHPNPHSTCAPNQQPPNSGSPESKSQRSRREQTEWLAIENEADRMAYEGAGHRDEQEGIYQRGAQGVAATPNTHLGRATPAPTAGSQ